MYLSMKLRRNAINPTGPAEHVVSYIYIFLHSTLQTHIFLCTKLISLNLFLCVCVCFTLCKHLIFVVTIILKALMSNGFGCTNSVPEIN